MAFVTGSVGRIIAWNCRSVTDPQYEGADTMTANPNALAEFFDLQGQVFADKCTSCGLCLEVCPVFPLTKASRLGSKAVTEKLTDLLKGGEPSEEVYELIYTCNRGCGLCAKACPEGLVLDYLGLIPAAARLAASGKRPPALTYQLMPGHRHNASNFLSSLQVKPPEMRWFTKPPHDPEPVDFVLFTGCATASTPHVQLETVAILEAMGLNFATLAGGDLCCGMANMLWGDLEGAQRQGQDLILAIAAFQPKMALFLCGACYITCAGTWPLFSSFPFESREMIQFLLENVTRIPFQHRVEKTVTVHDSCQVARIGTFDLTRQLLQAIPGLTLVEMEHNRAEALCCGGYTNTIHPEISGPMRLAPMDEAQAAGAGVMATVCGRCQQSFALLESRYSFEVQNYISLLAESIGVKHEDTFRKRFSDGSVSGVVAASRDYFTANGLTEKEVKAVLPEYLARLCPPPAAK